MRKKTVLPKRRNVSGVLIMSKGKTLETENPILAIDQQVALEI